MGRGHILLKSRMATVGSIIVAILIFIFFHKVIFYQKNYFESSGECKFEDDVRFFNCVKRVYKKGQKVGAVKKFLNANRVNYVGFNKEKSCLYFYYEAEDFSAATRIINIWVDDGNIVDISANAPWQNPPGPSCV